MRRRSGALTVLIVYIRYAHIKKITKIIDSENESETSKEPVKEPVKEQIKDYTYNFGKYKNMYASQIVTYKEIKNNIEKHTGLNYLEWTIKMWYLLHIMIS